MFCKLLSSSKTIVVARIKQGARKSVSPTCSNHRPRARAQFSIEETKHEDQSKNKRMKKVEAPIDIEESPTVSRKRRKVVTSSSSQSSFGYPHDSINIYDVEDGNKIDAHVRIKVLLQQMLP
ncbi:hypothetical protein L6452_19847 [Arctium lappa]|uniref:Uncharacterized protein n=1 Tax=Arctium lappa TaxID=4217 RepID=A0ACB9BA90_ARCLA|nr:hypothetical protein L6452_19847 [Arctium lappa]